MGDRTDDVASEMGHEIEIQRKMVFDCMIMVQSGILDKLYANNHYKYRNMKTQDDVGFFLNLANDRPTPQVFFGAEM